MKIIHVAGARPNFMKVAPVMRALRDRYPGFAQLLVHTGQHYDVNMSDAFFADLQLPAPDVHLGVGSGTQAEQTARVMTALEPILVAERPDWVVVVGDVNSTLAAAVVASKLVLPVAHVEAGLRSFDRTMPEEVNRVVTDQLSDLLFTTEASAAVNLEREGIASEKVHFVGNVMIDSLVHALPIAQRSSIVETLDVGADYAVVTLHRPSNVDDSATLRELLAGLASLAADRPVVFPVHPRTRQRIASGRLDAGAVRLVDPLGYLDFLKLMSHATLVITDSGGLQEETTYLGIPCLTVRPNTERPVTLTHGTNRLVASRADALVAAAREALGAARRTRVERPPLWDGHAAERIADVLGAQRR